MFPSHRRQESCRGGGGGGGGTWGPGCPARGCRLRGRGGVPAGRGLPGNPGQPHRGRCQGLPSPDNPPSKGEARFCAARLDLGLPRPLPPPPPPRSVCPSPFAPAAVGLGGTRWLGDPSGSGQGRSGAWGQAESVSLFSRRLSSSFFPTPPPPPCPAFPPWPPGFAASVIMISGR